MVNTERRKYPRHKTETGVTIHKQNEKIPAVMFNIGKGGIGLLTERGIYPGAEVGITLNYIDDYAIRGTVRWAQLTFKEGKAQYQLGIEADRILAPEDIWKHVFPDTAK